MDLFEIQVSYKGHQYRDVTNSIDDVDKLIDLIIQEIISDFKLIASIEDVRSDCEIIVTGGGA